MSNIIKVTFTLKDLSDAFYEGHGDMIKGLNNMNDAEKFHHLNKQRIDLSRNIKMKIATGQFRDAVELNSILKKEVVAFRFTLEPRKGYKLATFLIN